MYIEKKIEKINYNVKDITYCYGKRIILKNDGTVHEILNDDNYNLVAIEGGTNIKSISREYALDNNNNILKLDLNAEPIQYKTFDLYTLTKPAQKIFLETRTYEDISNFDFEKTNISLLALYEDGKVNVIGNSDDILSNQAIDAYAGNEEIYILEYNKVKIVSRGIPYMDGQELQSDKIYTGNVGDNYDVQIIEISGYEYKESIGALNGKYTNTEKAVVLKYQKIQEPGPEPEPDPEPDPKPEKGNVIVIYQDINGNQLRENKTITGNVGESYETEKLEIEGYEFVEVDGQERGNIVKENQFVTYKYKKKDAIETGKVTVKYIDENGNSLKEEFQIK